MKLIEHQEYFLKIQDNYSYELSQNRDVCKFSSPSTVQGIAKLYTVTQGKTLIYVGITKQAMSSRLNYGLKAKGKSGYYGYKWKNIRSNLKLNIWAGKSQNDFIPFNDMEIIEAEVAYLCRHLSSQWPKHQNEIHFHQSKLSHQRLALEIYELATYTKSQHENQIFTRRSHCK